MIFDIIEALAEILGHLIGTSASGKKRHGRR